MKNKIFKLGCVLALLLSGQAYSETMQCYVDTFAYDYYSDNYCDNSANQRSTTATYKLINHSQTIESVT